MDANLKKIIDYYPWHWADHYKFNLLGGQFDVKDHDFQVAIMNDDIKYRRRCYRKATQAVGTESYVLLVLHHLIHGIYPRGFLYLFPTRDEVSDFSDSRFKPLIDNNPIIKKYVQSTDRNNLKKIKNAFLYLRGARLQEVDDEIQSSSKIKSIPSDGFCCDELDEMGKTGDIETVIALAQGRCAQSNIKHEFYLSNPTIPDYGISALYDESDQQVWMIKCRHCGSFTCLEQEFPNCLVRQDDRTVYRACKDCRNEIFPCDGEWVATYPSKSEKMIGRTISHLNIVSVNPMDILDKWENPKTKKQTFYNLIMGMPYISAEERLTKNQIYDCCDVNQIMESKHQGPCFMGVDVQGEKKGFHVVIGCKLSENTFKIVKLVRFSGINDLYDIAKKFNVACAVIDERPEVRLMKSFAEKVEFEVFLCRYKENQRKYPDFDSKEHLVSINRTEMCDETHSFISTEGRCKLPRRDSEIEEYAKQMISTAKRLITDDKKGIKQYVYIPLGQDDYYHATNYALMAANRVSTCRKEEEKVKVKDKWGNWNNDESDHAAGSFMGV